MIMSALKTWIDKILVAAKMAMIGQRHIRPLQKQARDCRRTQEQVLLEILQCNRQTEFSRHLGLDAIRDYAQFASQIPVMEYEDLRASIERQAYQGELCHTAARPQLYSMTSGTTDAPKLIPVTEETIKRYRRTQLLTSYAIYRAVPGAFSGRVLAIASAAEEGVLAHGIPYGSMSGLLYRNMGSVVRRRYVLPPAVFAIADYEQRYREIARYALLAADITLVATANPSTLLRLAQVINQYVQSLLVEVGKVDHRRALALYALLTRKGHLVFGDIWPQVKVVLTWTGGNCAVLIPQLKQQFATSARFIELGYLSSEFRGTVTLLPEAGLQVPTFTDNFYEFVKRDDWEAGNPQFYRLHELEQGNEYYLFATTRDGLYRYHINDVVRATGWYHTVPTLEFVQKGKGVTNLTGEKLSESQVVGSLAEQGGNGSIRFFKMLACGEREEYVVYVEAEQFDIDRFDRDLGARNLEYQAKRASQRLKKPRLCRLTPGTGEAYRRFYIANGQREGQFKMVYLANRTDCRFDFSRHILQDEAHDQH